MGKYKFDEVLNDSAYGQIKKLHQPEVSAVFFQ